MIKGIKKALNNTVGKKNFHTLDVMINNAIKILPDPTTMITRLSDDRALSYSNPLTTELVANCTGGCYLGFQVRAIRDEAIVIYIYINDVAVPALNYRFDQSSDNTTRTTAYFPFWFKKGDKIKIIIRPSASLSFSNIGLYANYTKRNVLVEVEE